MKFFNILFAFIIYFMQPDYYRDSDRFVREDEANNVYRLTIPSVKLDFTGAYSVVARNEHGEARSVISLQVYASGTRFVVVGRHSLSPFRRFYCSLHTLSLYLACALYFLQFQVPFEDRIRSTESIYIRI